MHRGVPTALPSYELTNIVRGRAMDVREERGEARNTDILGEQVELGDPIPCFSLGRELGQDVSRFLHLLSRVVGTLTMSIRNTFGLMGSW